MTDGCRGCEAAMMGWPAVGHSEACRRRIETAMAQDGAVAERLRVAKRRRGEAPDDSSRPDGADIVVAPAQGADVVAPAQGAEAAAAGQAVVAAGPAPQSESGTRPPKRPLENDGDVEM